MQLAMCHAREHSPKLGGPGNDQVIMNLLLECKVLGVVSVMVDCAEENLPYNIKSIFLALIPAVQT